MSIGTVAANVLDAIKAALAPLESAVEGVGKDITAELVVVINQLPSLILSAIEAAVPVVMTGALAGTPISAIAAAVEAAALGTLASQGTPVAESDALALKGAVLATIANNLSATAAAAPAEAAEPAPAVTE